MRRRIVMRKIVLLFFVFFTMLGALSSAEAVKLQRAVPLGILNRVFPFEFRGHIGSCFIIDIDDRQYIITARHLVPGISAQDTIRIQINEVWRNIEVVPIFPKNDKTDIVALSANILVAPKMKILIEGGGLYVGQDVYFLGFPFGLATHFDKPSTSRIAFIKKAILSAVDTRPESGNIIYLDGHNNPGFSGGPVIFANYEQHERLQIAGVVSGYRNQPKQVMSTFIEDKNPNTSDPIKKIVHYVLENTGIVIAYDISEIVKEIKNKPIGFPLPKTKE